MVLFRRLWQSSIIISGVAGSSRSPFSVFQWSRLSAGTGMLHNEDKCDARMRKRESLFFYELIFGDLTYGGL